MKDIGIVAAVICVCVIACSIVNTLALQGGTKRILNTVLGVFVICAMIAPVKNAVAGFNYEYKGLPDTSSAGASADEVFDRQVITQTEKNLTKTLESLLDSESLSYKACEVKVKTDENGGIYISSVSIYITQKANAQRIIEKVREKFEVIPRLIKD